MVDYNKRLVEVDVILNHLSESDYNKIPEDVLQLIKDNMDKEYTWVFDESKPLKEQNVSRDTIAFLSYINMEYLLMISKKNICKNFMKLMNKKNVKKNIQMMLNMIIVNYLKETIKQKI